MSAPLRPHLPALTSMRFFAAVAVLLFHATEEMKGRMPAALESIFRNGFVGVSFFFILSGFVLTYTYKDRPSKLSDFFMARFARLYPVYALSLLVAAPFFFRTWLAGENADKTGALVAGKLLMIQSWVPWMTWNWNVPSWSLSTEAFFYLCFPLLMPLFAKIPSAFRWGLIPILLLGFAYSQPLSASLEPNYSLSPIRDLLHFAAGVLMALEFCEGKRAPRWFLGVSALAALTLLASFNPYPEAGLWRMALSTSLTAIIFGAASLETKPGPLLGAGWLLLLGEASYALYILHSPLAEFSLAVGRKLGLGFDSWILVIAYCLVSIAISIAVFKFFEAPLNKRIRAWWKSRGKAAAPASEA